jgi:Ca2+/Na+ antiporter
MMTGATVILLPILFTGKRLNRAEGLRLIACYGGYLFFMWPK